MNNIIVLGKGYLGKEFERHGFEVWGKDKLHVFPDNNLEAKLKELLNKYDTIINCIGIANTRWCEDNNNYSETLFINGYFPGILSTFCKVNNKKLVHISTGCLYDDTTKPNTETDFIAAHCNYTSTKYVGERLCDTTRDLILRPRLFFSDIKNKNNLLCKIQKFESFTGDKLDSFTCTSTVVGATKELLQNDQVGIFNVAQIGSATIARIAYWCNIQINSIYTAEHFRQNEGIYFVNSVMHVGKLLKYYFPSTLEDAIKLSYSELK